MSMDKKFLGWSLAYVTAGMGLGIYMAASHNHAQHVTHAHILLVGFVVSFIYASIHKLWLDGMATRLARIQYIVHHAAALTLFSGLFLLYGAIVPEAQIEPVLAAASISVFIAAMLMISMVISRVLVKA